MGHRSMKFNERNLTLVHSTENNSQPPRSFCPISPHLLPLPETLAGSQHFRHLAMSADSVRKTVQGASPNQERLSHLGDGIHRELQPIGDLVHRMYVGRSRRKECLEEQVAILSSALKTAQAETHVSSVPPQTTKRETVPQNVKYALSLPLPPIREEAGKGESSANDQPLVATEAKKYSNQAQPGAFIVETTGDREPCDTRRRPGISTLKRRRS